MAKKKELLEVLPIYKIENDCLVSVYGDVSVVFEVRLPELFTLHASVQMMGGNRYEEGDFRELNELWVKAFTVLPGNTIIHKQDYYTEENYTPRFSAETFLDRASERHFNERPYLNHSSFIVLTKVHPSRQSVTSMLTTLVRGRFIAKEMLDGKTLDNFFSTVNQFRSILESTKLIGLKQLTDSELVTHLERYMNLNFTGEIVPLTDIELGDSIKVGGRTVKFFTISDIEDMPETVYTHNIVSALSGENSQISVGFAAPVNLLLHCNHVYNQYIFKVDKHVEFPKLEQRATQMVSMGAFSKQNAVNSRLINEFLEYAAETGYNPVQCHFNVMVWTEDPQDMGRLRNETTAAISKMSVRPRETGSDGALLYWAAIPGAASDLPMEDRFWTFAPQAFCLVNQETNSRDDVSTFGIKVVDRLSGKPLYVDFSDTPMKRGWVNNRNKFILGPSGSGKSFLVNNFVRSYYQSGAHLVILDVGDSYQGLCGMLGGKYLTYQPEHPISFNPFYQNDRSLPLIEKLEAIKALIFTLWKNENEGQTVTRTEETMVALAVTSYFDLLDQHVDIFPCFNTFYEFLQDSFSTLMAEKKVDIRHFDFDGFMLTLEPYYKGGEYDFLLNSRQNLDLTNEPFVVFELDNIKDNKILFPVVTIIIMDTFLTKMRMLKDVRKIILIEEAWKAIMKPEMAGFIKYLYKTVRKHFGEAWLVTQEVDDILSSTIVKDSIIANADTKILMDQRKYQNKFEDIRRLLSMTAKEVNMALSLNRDNDPKRRYKEFFVSFGGQHSAAYGLEVSREEYFAYTTELPEKRAIERLKDQNGGSYEIAIREHVELSKP